MNTAPGPYATILLRDGTGYAGMVKSTSPTAITMAGDDNATRTIDLRDVKMIDYGEQAPAAPVRTDETIGAKTAVPGQTFAAEVARDVLDAAGDVTIPRGS